MRFAAFLLLVAACHPSTPPGPVPPDATDAASSDCAKACGVLAAMCGVQPADCAITATNVEQQRHIRVGGAPLTCADIAEAQSKADVQRLGIACP